MNMTSKRLLISFALVVSVGAAAEPTLNGGTWQAVDPPQALRTVQGKEPPLLPQARAIYQQNIAARKAGKLDFDGTEKCLAPGIPRLLTMTPGAFEFLQRPEQIVMTYEWNRLVRVIDMNVPQHEPAGPTYAGQSVGRWEGNTLVIDSVGFNDTTLLDNTGLPHSDQLHVIERYTPSADGKGMTARITVEDPKTFSKPWDTTLTFKHDPKGQIREDVCLERKAINWGRQREGT